MQLKNKTHLRCRALLLADADLITCCHPLPALPDPLLHMVLGPLWLLLMHQENLFRLRD